MDTGVGRAVPSLRWLRLEVMKTTPAFRPPLPIKASAPCRTHFGAYTQAGAYAQDSAAGRVLAADCMVCGICGWTKDEIKAA